MIVSPTLAQALLALNTDPRQRHFDGARTEAHRRQIAGGAFRAAPPICFHLEGDRLVLHNGQHRLAAIAASGREVALDVVLHDGACPLGTTGAEERSR